ncbi:hypothetical protein CQW23_07543 [Capsicum baccatum]|uniref:Uncharacterized protein n=1 Tax=Capsicum baccatum TaxID=33114 RepID=A0A2G2X6X6_CAPBA|nr:hypothetical protein CQW23_07543 [Capsicum baccatum]
MATVPNTFCLPVTPFTTLRRKRNHRLLLGHFNGPPQFSISSTQPFRQQFISCRKLNRSVISSSYITGTTFDAFVSEKDKIEEADDSFIAFQSIEDHKFEESDDSLVERVQSIEVVSWSVLWKLVSWHKLRLLASVFSLVGGTACTLTVPLISENDPKFEESDDSFVAVVQPIEVISWGFLWKLVSRHKLRLLASVCSLVVCTTCTLTMPLLSGTNLRSKDFSIDQSH